MPAFLVLLCCVYFSPSAQEELLTMEQDDALLKRIRDALQQSEARQRLQDAYQRFQERLTTGIGQAAEMVGISDTQVRYWGKQGALAPARTRIRKEASDHPGQRRYGLKDLMRLAVVKELLEASFSLEEIVTFLEADPDFIQTELTSLRPEPAPHPHVRQRINQANQISFWRFLLPRALYLALCLLHEAPLREDTGLCLPIEPDGSFPAGRPKIEKTEDLSLLGKSLLAWHVRGHSFTTFLDEAPRLNYPQRYRLQCLDALSEPKTGAYAVPHQDVLTLLGQSKPPARQAAQRLLAFVQRQAGEWIPFVQDSMAPLVYYAPEFRSPVLGDSLLRQLAEVVVALGGVKSGARKGTQEPRWQFCTVLLPRESLAPLLHRSLVVQAQSARSPYHIGETTLSPSPPIAISLRAFQSGQMLYYPHISEREPHVFGLAQEVSTRSAIAVPIESEYGESLGVMYVASAWEEAFSRESDQLLLRMIARLMGELLLTYQARHMLVDRLAQVIERPKVVDPFFKGFATESDFIEKVEQLLAQIQDGQTEGAAQHLSLIAINIDQLTTKSYQYGEHAARNLVRAVGRRLQHAMLRLLQGKPQQETYLYRICGDHFLLLLKDVEWEDVWNYARRWHKDLKEHKYAIDAARVADEQSIPVNLQVPLDVSTSMAVVGYEVHTLKAMLESLKPSEVRANLTLTLDTGINLAREAGRDAIARLEPGATTFVVQRDPEKEPAGT